MKVLRCDFSSRLTIKIMVTQSAQKCRIAVRQVGWYFRIMRIRKKKKITVFVPEDLLKQALESSGEGTSATVHQALKLLAASATYRKLQSLRGKVNVKIDLATLRED